MPSTGENKGQIFNIERDIFHELTEIQDTVVLSITDEIILDISHGVNHSYIHVKPGKHLVLDSIASNPTLLGITGSSSAENDYLTSFAMIYFEQSQSYYDVSFERNEVDSFLVQINLKYEPLVKLLAEIENDLEVSVAFKSAMNYRLTAVKGNDLILWQNSFEDLPKE